MKEDRKGFGKVPSLNQILFRREIPTVFLMLMNLFTLYSVKSMEKSTYKHPVLHVPGVLRLSVKLRTRSGVDCKPTIPQVIAFMH
jgi:hypothetical protein